MEKKDTPDLLVMDKDELKASITDRIMVGNELVVRHIRIEKENQAWWTEFINWNDFNEELLKQAFEHTNNAYYEEYTRKGNGAGGLYFGNERKKSFEEYVEISRSEMTRQLSNLTRFLDKIPLLKESPNKPILNPTTNKLDQLITALKRFHKVAQSLRYRRAGRAPFEIQDEYDVQYLLQGLLQIYFDDLRPEDYVPSHAGANSRTDFVIKNEYIVLETKITNEHVKDKELGEQLMVDIGRYREHPNCRDLILFVYDKGDYIRNKQGLASDLEKHSSQTMKITVVICPE